MLFESHGATMSQLASWLCRVPLSRLSESMKNYYSQCCDCGTPYREVPQEFEALFECPNCGLSATLSDLEQLSADLERDQPTLKTRLEAEQEIRSQFQRSTMRLHLRESQDRN